LKLERRSDIDCLCGTPPGAGASPFVLYGTRKRRRNPAGEATITLMQQCCAQDNP
jgi:hypothetical protein